MVWYNFYNIYQRKNMNKEQLKELWNENNYNTSSYINKEQLCLWIMQAFEKKKVIEGIPTNEQINQLIEQHIEEVHSIKTGNVRNLEFKFEDSSGAYDWTVLKLKSREKEENKNQKQQAQSIIQEENNEEKQGSEKKEEIKNGEEEGKHQERQNDSSQKQKSPHDAEHNELEEMNEFVPTEEERKIYEPTITNKYEENLKIIFQHYCRLSCPGGSDLTFDEIHHKGQFMNINKFMVFVRQFMINKLSGISRTLLMEIFKKNSSLYQEIDFQHFIKVLEKIGVMSFGQGSTNTEGKKQFEQLLLFMEVNNQKVFQNKMNSLKINIKFSSKKNKKQLSSYKFKFTSSNGKSKEQIRQEIEQRKQLRSQKKPKLKINQNLSHNQLHRNPVVKKREISQPRYHTMEVSGTLPPPIPPVRKKIQLNPYNSHTNKHVTGYSKIYRLKMGKEFQKQELIEEKMRVNNVVGEARKLITSESEDSQINYSKFTSLVDSHFDYRPQNTKRTEQKKPYFQSSQLAPIIQENDPSMLMKKNANPHELNAILGEIDDEQDEYLVEHLEREKRNQRFHKPIEEKIKYVSLQSSP